MHQIGMPEWPLEVADMMTTQDRRKVINLGARVCSRFMDGTVLTSVLPS